MTRQPYGRLKFARCPPMDKPSRLVIRIGPKTPANRSLAHACLCAVQGPPGVFPEL
jgi:hypothetical protein